MYDDLDEDLDDIPLDDGPDDIITRDEIDAIVDRHDSDMDDARVWMGMAKATVGGRFWEWVNEQGKGSTDRKFRMFDDKYEINLIKKGVSVYHSSLFPKRMKAVVDRLATSTGEAEKAQTLLNSWLFTDDMRARIDTAIRQALLYPGVGLKVSYDPRSGEGHKALSPHERVYARVFPWYELLLDTYANDLDDARYYGHISYKSRREVSDLYDIPYHELRGDREHSFLDDDSAYHNARYGGGGDGGDGLEGDYVRVLELCNLVDTLDGNDYPGRFEVHLIDQGEHSMEAVYVGEMPLWRPDGRPVQHIVPLIFEHEAEYPLQGIAPCRSWLHQQAEVNAYRSQMASESRKNKTVFLYDKNLGSDIIQRIASARTMEGIAIDPDNVVGGDLRRAVVAIEQPPISVNVREHAAKAEQDLLSSFNFSPSAIGITQNVTAQEIRYQRDYTDSEFGRMAAARDRTLSTFAYLALRAFVAAMLDDGDMESDEEGAEEDADLETADLAEDADAALFDDETGASLREEDADEDPRLVDEDLDSLAGDDEEDPDEDPDEEDDGDTFAEALDDGVEVDDDAAELYAERGIETTGEETIQLLDSKRELMVIRVEDIDSEFDIGFTETGRTPASDAEIRANLAQILPVYMQLFEAIAQGGPQGVIAEAAARAYYTEYSLPETLNPDRLLSQLAEQQQQPAGMPPGGGPPGMPPGGAPAEGAPGEAPPAEGGGAPGDPAVLLNELVTLHKDNPDAVPALKTLLAALQQVPPEVAMQIGEQLARILALPPEAQVEGLQTLAQALTGDPSGAAPGGAPPEAGPPQPPAEAAPGEAPPAEQQAEAPPPQAAAEGDAAVIQRRLQEAAPSIQQAVELAQEVLPQLQAAVGEQGAEPLAQMGAAINRAVELLNAAIQAPSLDEAEDMMEDASDLLEQAEGLLEMLSQAAGPDLQPIVERMVDAVSDAADALTDDDPADGPGADEEEDGDDV